jgi:hypothetical protein
MASAAACGLFFLDAAGLSGDFFDLAIANSRVVISSSDPS